MVTVKNQKEVKTMKNLDIQSGLKSGTAFPELAWRFSPCSNFLSLSAKNSGFFQPEPWNYSIYYKDRENPTKENYI